MAEETVLASAARTATIQSAALSGIGDIGIYILVDTTATAVTPVVTLSVQVRNELASDWHNLFTSSTTITAVGLQAYYVGRSVGVDAGITNNLTGICAVPLPQQYRIVMTHADADSITYSVVIRDVK